MAGLHYGEWGGPLYRVLYGFAGLAASLLFATGVLIWWMPRRMSNQRSTPRPNLAEAEVTQKA